MIYLMGNEVPLGYHESDVSMLLQYACIAMGHAMENTGLCRTVIRGQVEDEDGIDPTCLVMREGVRHVMPRALPLPQA